MKTKKILLFTLILSVSNLFAQTGPGGIGNSSTCPFWLDAHSMGGANGALVSSWTDYSGNDNHAVQADPADQPTYQTGAINGRDAIVFTGGQVLTAGSEANMNGINYFQFYLVGQIDNTNLVSIPFNVDYGSSSADAVFSGMFTQSGNFRVYGRKNTSLATATFGSSSGVSAYAGTYDLSATDLTAERNFSVDALNPLVNRATSTHEEFWVGGTNSFGSSHYYSHGKFGDIFVFTSTLNTAEQNILENYLSAKYGMAATTDMYTFEGTYGLGVVGIGQDDAANFHTDSQGNGSVRINTPSDLNDGEYLFIGHDDVNLTSFNLNTNVPTSLPGASRFVRQWRAEKTGDLGTITLVFDLDATTNFSADPNNYRLLIDSDADMSGTIDHIHSGTYNAGDETITFTGIDLQTGDFFTLAGDTPADINSVASGNWSDPNTWDCTCVPTSFNNVNILSTHNVAVDEDAFANTLHVQSGGTLTMNQEFTLSLFQDWTIDGSLALTAGGVTMAGNVAQSINANGASVVLHDITIDNTGGETVTMLPAEYTLEGSLLLNTGDLVIDNTSGGILIVESTSGTTGGRVGAIQTGCSITGNVTVRRFLPAGNADYRDMASPVTDADLTQWDDNLSISGDGFPDGCAYGPGGCYHSVKQYYMNDYHDITSINHPLTNGEGFEIYIGTDLNSWAGGLVDVTGTLNSNASVPVTVTLGWNIMGNPYASPVLFSTVNRYHIDNYFYVYDAATGDYQWYDGASNTASISQLNNGLLASGQAFWTMDWGTLTWEQSDKVDQTATFIRGQEIETEEEDNSIYFTLYENQSTYQTTIAFDECYACLDEVDTIHDIMHLSTGIEKAPNMAIQTSENELIRKNWINAEIKDKVFTLYNKFHNPGYYTIESENEDVFDNYAFVYLFDHLTGEKVDMRNAGQYVFYTEAGEFNRFSIIFSNEVSADGAEAATLSLEPEFNEISINQMGHSVNIFSEEFCDNVQVILYNGLGQQELIFDLNSLNKGNNLIKVPNTVRGVRILSINNNGKLITKKLVF